jgi:phosphoenolpyruvate-protein phosphotransferase (PTS system enzyme I)
MKNHFNLEGAPGEIILSADISFPHIAMGPAYPIKNEIIEPYDAEMHESMRHLEREEFDLVYDVRMEGTFAVRRERISLLPVEARSEARVMLGADIAIKNDPGLRSKINAKIAEGKTASRAVYEVYSFFMEGFASMADRDPKLAAKVAELRDLRNTILQHLNPLIQPMSLEDAPDGSIISTEIVACAEAHLLRSDKPEGGSRIPGVVTSNNVETDHFSIMAQASNVVVARISEEDQHYIKPDDIIIIDGHSGIVIINPCSERRQFYQTEIDLQKASDDIFLARSQKETHWPVSLDGQAIRIGANIGHSDEMNDVKYVGARAVGLYRTETAVLMRSVGTPSEDEWHEIFSIIHARGQGRKITIRTLDFSGDKAKPEFKDLTHEDRLKYASRQIGAALRVVKDTGKNEICIMIPVVTSMEEMADYQQVMLDKAEYLETSPLHTGAMVEVPGFIDELEQCHFLDLTDPLPDGKKRLNVDFLSIGTNDLIAAILGYDRFSGEAAERYDPTNPSVLKALRRTAALQTEERNVGMCGNMASQLRYFALVIGAGITHLSAGISNIPGIKELARRIDTLQARQLDDKIMTIQNREERERILDEFNLTFLGLSPNGVLDPDWEPLTCPVRYEQIPASLTTGQPFSLEVH